MQQRNSNYGLRALTSGSNDGFTQYKEGINTITSSNFDEYNAMGNIPNENSSVRNAESYIDEDTPERHPMSLRSSDLQPDQQL